MSYLKDGRRLMLLYTYCHRAQIQPVRTNALYSVDEKLSSSHPCIGRACNSPEPAQPVPG
jgi:hypothetical protein